MFEIKFEKSYGSEARTLEPEIVHDGAREECGMFTRTHSNGWTVTGRVVEDWYYWVNDFVATHPIFGKVWGNYEEIVYADTEAGYLAFTASFPPHVWDYHDI